MGSLQKGEVEDKALDGTDAFSDSVTLKVFSSWFCVELRGPRQALVNQVVSRRPATRLQ